MSMFKKGDRIIVDQDDFCGSYKDGDEFEVIHCDGEVVTFIDRDGDTRYLRHGCIKPVPVAEATGTDASAQAVKPKFKVGDRVRVVNNHTDRLDCTGQEGVVRSADDDGDVVVRLADGDRFFKESELEPAALTIQAGRYYRTRDGRKVGPMRETLYGQWVDTKRTITSYGWSDNGTFIAGATSRLDLIAEWVDEPTPAKPANDNGSTAGFTVPLCAYEDDFDICGHRDSDDDIVQLSVSELTAALAESLKVARKVGKTIKRGDLVILARPALVTGVDRYHASVQTDGGNYSLPLAALTAA